MYNYVYRLWGFPWVFYNKYAIINGSCFHIFGQFNGCYNHNKNAKTSFEHTTYTEKNRLEGVQWRYIETVSSRSLISVCVQNVLSQYVQIYIQTIPTFRADIILCADVIHI